MTAVWLLPIVACEVAASGGGLLLGHLAADTHAVAILLGSYVLWGCFSITRLCYFNDFNVAVGLT